MPSTSTDRIDGLSTSVAIKAPVACATTGNITLSGEQTIDGVDVTAIGNGGYPDRVLVKDQINAVDNGIWEVSTGAWSRSRDFDGNRDITQGTLVFVYAGTVNGRRAWHVTTDAAIVIGTSEINFELWPEIASSAELVAYGDHTVADKLGESVSLADYNASLDGITDDTAELASALTAAGTSNAEVFRNPGTALVTSLTNPYGVEFTGPGEIIKAVTGGYQRLDTYADKHKIAIGKEYLYRVYARLALGGTVTAFAYGDSTIAGGNGESTAFNCSNIIGRLMRDRGLGRFSLTNRGVGGTQVSDLNAIPDLTANSDIILIKYGINDGTNNIATRLATFQTNLRSKLAAIRGNGFGSLTSLAIVLVGPNSTSDSVNNRDERWYEQLRGIYIAAARDYQCVYFDTYAYLKDSRGAAGLWMDNPYADGRAVHPLDPMQAWIWGGIIDYCFAPSESRMYATNHLTNQSSAGDSLIGGTWAAASLPNQFPFGVTIQRATTGNGAPFDGFVETIVAADAGAIQRLWTYSNNQTKCVTRTADTGSNLWYRWTGGVVAENLTLSNGWVNYGSTFGTPSASVSVDGYCFLKGMIKSGTTTAATVVGTLPAGMLPAEDSIHLAATNAGSCLIKITSAGNITLQSAGDATFTSLDGVCFKVA